MTVIVCFNHMLVMNLCSEDLPTCRGVYCLGTWEHISSKCNQQYLLYFLDPGIFLNLVSFGNVNSRPVVSQLDAIQS